MAAIDLYVVEHYWDAGYVDGELGINPYAYGGDWWLQPLPAKPEQQREQAIEQERAERGLSERAAAVIARVARQQQRDAAEREELLRAEIKDEGLRWKRQYAQALVAFVEVERIYAMQSLLASERSRQRAEEEAAIVLLLLH